MPASGHFSQVSEKTQSRWRRHFPVILILFYRRACLRSADDQTEQRALCGESCLRVAIPSRRKISEAVALLSESSFISYRKSQARRASLKSSQKSSTARRRAVPAALGLPCGGSTTLGALLAILRPALMFHDSKEPVLWSCSCGRAHVVVPALQCCLAPAFTAAMHMMLLGAFSLCIFLFLFLFYSIPTLRSCRAAP